MSKAKIYIIYFSLVTVVFSCKKAEPTKNDVSLDNPYCNLPEAINYNWGFPGKPDNTKCIFPTQVFKGSYSFIDSILDIDYKLKKTSTFDISISAVSNTKMYLKGFCPSGDSISMTADRYYKSYIDSLVVKYNNVDYKVSGQYLCSSADTINGYMTRDTNDSTKLTIFFTVLSDSGLYYHKGTATKK